MARPMPAVEPVMRAVFPVKSIFMGAIPFAAAALGLGGTLRYASGRLSAALQGRAMLFRVVSGENTYQSGVDITSSVGG